MIVNGFIEPVVKALPMEFAVEMNRLIELEMEDRLDNMTSMTPFSTITDFQQLGGSIASGQIVSVV